MLYGHIMVSKAHRQKILGHQPDTDVENVIINAPLHFCLFSVFQDMSTKAFASKVQRDPLFAKRFSPTFNLNDRFIELTFYGHKISTKVFRFFSILRDVDLSAILLFLFCQSFFFCRCCPFCYFVANTT